MMSLTLSYLTLHYHNLPCRILPYLILLYQTLPFPIIPYLAVSYLTLPYGTFRWFRRLSSTLANQSTMRLPVPNSGPPGCLTLHVSQLVYVVRPGWSGAPWKKLSPAPFPTSPVVF